jgi:flagellar basal-body rod modification protein FlgD
MTTVPSTTSATPPASTANNVGVVTDQASLNNVENQFLTLLTTQLKNQDPTSPMDTSQFTSQLVSMSALEQQLTTNQDLSKLVTASTNNQTQLGLSYIGLDVSMTGNTFSYDPSKISTVGISYNLASASAKTQINIVDSKGNTVYTTAGSTTAGDNTFKWNGTETDGTTAPAGTYTVQVSASSATNTPVSVTTQVPGQVTGMQTAGDGTVDLVVNNTQVVPLSSITSAWVPSSNSSASTSSTGSGS